MLPMIRSELIQRIAAQYPHLYEREIERIIRAMLEEITAALSGGGRVEIRGFGVLSTKRRLARIARNPRTGAEVAIASKVLPTFRAGKDMRMRLNPPGRTE